MDDDDFQGSKQRHTLFGLKEFFKVFRQFYFQANAHAYILN